LNIRTNNADSVMQPIQQLERPYKNTCTVN